MGHVNLVFDVILRLSEALVCFGASGDNFLRSITRATVNKNDGKRKVDFLTLFWDFQKLSFLFRTSGDNLLRSITRGQKSAKKIV